MTWRICHESSEAHAKAASGLKRHGEFEQAIERYAKAAEAEEQALDFLNAEELPRTYGITAVSASALWFKAERFDRAGSIARAALKNPSLPNFALDQLNELLTQMKTEERPHGHE